LSSNNKLIFTADRDEKIRCSKYPDSHQIEYFLLGHTQAVANIAVLSEDQYLLSISIVSELMAD
jgi:WD40 repeat protein